MKYNLKMIPEKVTENVRKREEMLKDLLDVLPKLKQHKLDKDLHSKIKNLRTNRKLQGYKLELTRNFNGKVLSASGVVNKPVEKIKVVKTLKDELRKQIKQIRKDNLPPFEDYTFAEGVTVRKLAEVYTEPGSFIKVMRRKVRNTMLGGSRKPKDNDNYIGIELEFASKKDRNFICDLLFENDLGAYVAIKDDGSIGSGTKLKETHKYAHEIAVLAKQSEFEAVVDKLCHLLNTQCDVKVDKSCGLHVHLDMRNRDPKKSFANFVSIQHFLYAMIPANRKNGKYSVPIKGKEWRDSPDSRYHGINVDAYRKYKTIEIRMHSGTTDAEKITGWVRLLVAAVEAAPIARALSTTKGLQKALGISDALRKYIESRICKFAKQHEATKLADNLTGCMPELPKVEEGEAPVDTTSTEESEAA